MKKVYSKPDILFEDFSLSTNIAAGCAMIAGYEGGKYGVKFGGLYIFTDKCFDNVGTNEWEGICYHVPNEGFNAFSS